MAVKQGPRLGTKLFILTSFILVIIPWFSYLYLAEMEGVLLESQRNAQLLTARGVATLLNGRSDLFDELPINPDGYEQLYAYPLEKPIRIDGNDADWRTSSITTSALVLHLSRLLPIEHSISST